MVVIANVKVNGALDQEGVENLLAAVRQIKGVVKVEFFNPDRLVVSYDNVVLRLSNLLFNLHGLPGLS